jgi:hypothetical protein
MVETLDGKTHDLPLDGTVEEIKWVISERLDVPVSRLIRMAKGRIANGGKKNETNTWQC